MTTVTGLRWVKSSYSGTEGDNCVEVAEVGVGVLVRDSKDVRRPHVCVEPDAWSAFVRYAAGG